MGQYYNPSIVSNGLIAVVDPGNRRCYPGIGLTAFPIIQTGFAGTINGGLLVGGVGFGTSNLGVFNFDGSNDYIDMGNSSDVKFSTGSVNIWAKTSSPGSSYRGIVVKQFAWGLFYNNSNLSAFNWGIGGNEKATNINMADNQWKNICYTFQDSVANGSIIYLGGTSVNTHTIYIQNQNQNLNIGAESYAGGQHANCSIGYVGIYNRILTAAEVLRNYNALRDRFRL